MLRVNLGFDETDPEQAEAYMLLKGKKRRKALYITELILKDADESGSGPVTAGEVREIIREEIQKAGVVKKAADEPSRAETESSSPDKKEIPDSFYGSDDNIISQMLSSMPGFDQ